MDYFLETHDPEVKRKVLEAIGQTQQSIDKEVENIKVWLKTQPHLPQVLIDRQIESYLILCKGNVEKIKSKIDMYFTMRSRFPDVFTNSHPLSERMKHTNKYISYIPLPKLCQDLSRIFVIKVRPCADPMDMDVYAGFAQLINVVEIRFFEDMCNGHTVFFDLEHVKVAHLIKFTPMFIKTIYIIGDGALTTRVNAVHLLNAPGFIDQTLLIVKSIIKPKLAERIVVHRDTSSAVGSIDKDVLPKDYGGSGKSLDELEADYKKKIEEYKDFFDRRELWKVDEDLRPEKYKDDGFFGCFGNFKQLQLD